MASILLVPDIFFHRWNQEDGELWLCLRPFVKKNDFHLWAADPHGAGHTYKLPQSADGSLICKPDEDLRSINLPTCVDLWMRVIRGPLDPAPWLRVARNHGCITDPGIADPELVRDHEGALQRPGTQPAPFVRLFNETVRERHANTTGDTRAQLSEWLELRLESGRTVGGKYGSEIRSVFRNEADPAKPSIPFFQPKGTWSTQFGAEERLASNLFWFNGLMLPLGAKPVSASISKITSIDIWLADCGVPLDATEPPDPPRFRFSLPQFSAQPAAPYFNQISDSYAARLVCNLEDPTVLRIQSLPSHPANGDGTDPVAYFSPTLQGYQKGKDTPLKEAWEYLSRMNSQSAEELGLGKPAATQVARRRLIDLVGLEVRSPATNALRGTFLEATPGIVLTGKIRPYRRFPRVAGPKGSYLATVMTFEPSGDGADLLERVETLLGTGDGGLKTLIENAIVPGGWKLQHLSTAQMPWDGPRKVYRLLARRTGDTAKDDDVRTCEAQSVTMWLKATSALKTEAGRLPAVDAFVRWLWRPDAAIRSVDALRNACRQQFGAWSDMPVSALFIAGGTPLTAEIDAAYLGDYTFFQANSRTRLEKILGVYTNIPNQAPANCVPSATPSQDFEDDLTNYNTGSALKKSGELLDERVRYAQGSSGNWRGLHRRQAIPFVFEWPHAPNNNKGDDPKAEILWPTIRDYVKKVMKDPLPEEPFRAQMEHTYCTTAAAVDEQGQPIQFQRGLTFDWAPDLPTSAETLDSKSTTLNAKAARFLECRYLAGEILLEFNPRVLDTKSTALGDLGHLDRRALAVRAWRSLVEMMRAQSLALALDLRLFDMASQAGLDLKGAASLARQGFTGHWRDALREIATKPITLPMQARQDLVEWCALLLNATSLPVQKFILRIPVPMDIGKLAHVARVRLLLGRQTDQAPPPTMRLVPITQQPTLGSPAPDSLWSAWTQIGFSRDSDLASLPQDEQQRLREAFARWHESLRVADESITPVVPTTTAGTPPQSAVLRGDLQALVAELPGTDWFTPIGAPMSEKPLAAQLVLLPLGFAPCARHPQLGRAAQQVVQRALVHLNDAIDLAYEGWAKNVAMDWPLLFERLAALASPAGQGGWTGPVPSLVNAVTDILLKPQPDAQSPEVDGMVAKLIGACLDNMTPAGQSPLAVRRMLLESPALFADAKALLMSRVDFVASTRAGSTPPPGTLARAQFTRNVRPPPVPGKPLTESDVAVVEAIAGWKQMVAAGLAGETGSATRLGFLETLDDARYDNAFTVRADGQQLQAFEAMVDPHAMEDAKARVLGSWQTLPPLVPGKAENVATVENREVRLASRAVLEPPEQLWSGSSDSLAAALASVTIGQKGWTVSGLSRGERPAIGAPVAKDGLEVAAFRRQPAQQKWNSPAYSDEVLVHFVFRVTGDEEATSAGSTDCFLNDGFFIEGSRSKGQAPLAALSSPPLLDSATEAVLRGFAKAARGTSEAAQLAKEYLLDAPATFGHLQGLIRTEAAPDISPTWAVLRPQSVGAASGDFCVGGGSVDWRDRIRDVCLFRPVSTEPNSTAYLVVGVMLDVWTGWDVTIVQGRNMPFERWGANCASPSGRTPPPFNPAFWQTAAQSSRPTTQYVNNVLKNGAADWGREKRTFDFPASWHGTEVTVEKVLEKLLFEAKLQVGPHIKPSPTVLRSSTKALAYGTPLGITIYQEQFGVQQGKPQEVRFPCPTVLCQAGGAATTRIVFPQEYATFSIDIRWRKPDGSTPLVLERIFAKPAAT